MEAVNMTKHRFVRSVFPIAVVAAVVAFAFSGHSFKSQLATQRMTVVQSDPSSVFGYPLAIASEFTGHVTPSRVVQVDTVAATDQSVGLCAQMSNLELASLTGPGLTDTGLAHLAGCPRLKELCVANTSIDGTGLIHLRQNTSLERLDLSDTHVSDATVATIVQLQSVQKLFLSGPLVSDKSLSRLFTMPNLSLLYLNNTSVSEATCQSLVDTHPHVHCTLIVDGQLIQLSPNNDPVRVAIATNSK